ncbi:MAG: hypothetical protein K9J30_03020 [Bacteroidales bacterium]|nr:hypothetical protein [Bacteroidales bacterium]
MKRIAIFVEGQTEQILVRRMLETVMAKKNIAIQTMRITGGHNVRMSFTVLHAAQTKREADFYVLIYDCGGETNVKSYMLAQRQSLLDKGYTCIIGLRDVYPNFTHDQIPKLKKGLNYQLSQKGAVTHIFLAVMETEAWFLGEYRHFLKVSSKLTPEYIESQLGFNPRRDNMELREAPAFDLKHVYRLVNHDYIKKRNKINSIVSKLDFDFFTHKLSETMSSLGYFVRQLEDFFD